MSAGVSLSAQGVAKVRQDSARWSDLFASALVARRRILFGLMAALYLLGFNGQWLVGPDSALYLGLGKNLALGRGYTFGGMPQTLAYPGLPVALAGFFRFFGDHAIAAADAFILLCGAAVIALTYRLLILAFDRPTAVVVTLGMGISHEFYRYCYEILTDVPFAAGVMAMLAGHEAIFYSHAAANGKRRWWDWALLLGGLVVVVSTRPTMIGLLAAWMAAMLWALLRGRSPRRLIVVAAACVAAAVTFFVLLDPRGVFGRGGFGYEQWAIFGLTRDLSHRLSHEVLDNVKDLFGLSAARSVFGVRLGAWWINAIFGSIVLIAGIAWMPFRPLWGLWVAITVGMVILTVSHDRYMLEILPLLVAGWWQTLRTINHRIGGLAGNIAFAIFIPLGILPNTFKDGAMVRDQQRRPFYSYYKDGRYPPYLEMAGELTKLVGSGDIVLCPTKMSRVMTYWSDRRVLEEGDNFSVPPDGKLLVLLDPADGEFQNWLASQGISEIGPALASVARTGGKPPLLLLQGRQK